MSSALSAGLQDVRKPSTRWRCTYFYLLRVGTTWCKEGEDTPSPPHPCFAARTAGLGWGARPGMASPLATESQSQSPGTCPWPGLVGGSPPLRWVGRPAPWPSQPWLCSGCWRTAAPWLLGSQFSPPCPAKAHQATVGAPCPSGTLGHTLYHPPCPHTQSLSSQLHFIFVTPHTYPLQLQPPPPKVAGTVSKVLPELDLTCSDEDWTSESSSWGAGPMTPEASGRLPCCPTLLTNPGHTSQRRERQDTETASGSPAGPLQAGPLHFLPKALPSQWAAF